MMDQRDVVTRYNWMWEELRTGGVGVTRDAADVPMWTRHLLLAQSDSECREALRHLRGKVVRQGSVYESAEAFMDYCLSFLESLEVSALGCGVGDALDLIVEIVEGEPDPSEVACGNGDVVDKCQSLLRIHAELLYRLAESTDEYVVFDAVELLSVVFPGEDRLLSLVERVGARDLRVRSEAIHESFVLLLEWLRNGGESGQ